MKSKYVMLAAVLLFFSLCVNAYAYDMVVARDGSGDYMSIQAAIDAVASNSAARTEIYIKTGLYNAEKLFIPADKQNISLIGESRSETIISYHIYDCSAGRCPVEDAALWSDENIRTSATLTIKADGFLAENLTLQNTAGPVGQAQAITVRGDKAAFINCDIKSYQDTIYFWNDGKRAYFEGCLVVGRTDYIYGGGVVFFQNCEIRSWGGGWITAPSTSQNQKYGFVFNNCTLTYATGSPRSGDDGRSVALGRPWHNYPKVTWLYCDMTGKIDPLGWPTTWNMSYAATSTDLELYEYKNTGAGADMSGRADWAGIRALNADEASLYTRQAVLAGNDGWDPATDSDDNGGQTEAEATLTKHGAGSSTQTVNLGEPIDEFYYAWTNATSVNVTGLPSGVNAAIDTGARTVTISGTPAVAGTFKFTVTTVGGANDAFRSGTLTVIDGGSSSDSTNGGTGEASCSNPSNTALPFSKDGAGEYCWVTSGEISDINSWNMQLVEINGETFTNTWSNRMPAKIDGNYTIHYVGKYAWSHLSVNGSGGASSPDGSSNDASGSSSSSSTETDSSESSSASGDGDELVLQENETGFCSVDGTIDSNHTGFTGSGFANTVNEAGSRIVWRISVQTSGTYTLDWRYANGASTSRNATVSIGNEQADVSFSSTGGWTSWTNDVAYIYLNPGENFVTLVADTASGLPNIDSLSIAGSSLSRVDCAEPDGDDGGISITDTAPGWASQNGGTTGGGTNLADAVTVSSMSALQSEAGGSERRIIFVRPGTYNGTLSIGANKTIVGTGPGVTIRGNVKISGSDRYNVILRNLAVRGLTCGSYDECKSGPDALYIGHGAHNVWVDHLDIADGEDGNLDITRAADYVTVSWTKFHYTYDKEHRFSNLIAGSDDETESRGKLKTTYMNCWWGARVDSRQPRGRFGDIHMLNNYHSTGGGQMHGVGYDMALIAENCYYDEPGRSIFKDMGSPRGWRGIGNAGSASNMNDSRGSVFSIPYRYSAMPASQVKAVVTSANYGAGNSRQLAQ